MFRVPIHTMRIKVFHFNTWELVTGCGPDTSEAELHVQLVRAHGSCQLYGDGGRAVRPDSNRTAEGNYWWLPQPGELQGDRAGMLVTVAMQVHCPQHYPCAGLLCHEGQRCCETPKDAAIIGESSLAATLASIVHA